MAVVMAAFPVRATLGLREMLRNFSSSCRRYLATQATVGETSKEKQEPQQDPAETKKDKWIPSFFVRRIDPGHESHSNRLSDKDVLYELQIHSVKPECMGAYLSETSNFIQMMNDKKTGAELIGSWTVEIGDQDEAIHIWKYPGGYPQLSHATTIYRVDEDFVHFREKRNQMIRSRKNQIMLAFSYWGGIKPRPGSNIYELRSYVLKPGTMIEWGNYWAKGIKFRQEYGEATAGFFSHIGDLYVAHHLWGKPLNI